MYSIMIVSLGCREPHVHHVHGWSKVGLETWSKLVLNVVEVGFENQVNLELEEILELKFICFFQKQFKMREIQLNLFEI